MPGEDYSHELEQVKANIDRLRREADAGLVITEEDERVYIERLKAQIERRSRLEEMPSRPAGWVTETTGDTYASVWATEDHRQLLLDGGIRFVLNSGRPFNFELYSP